LTLDPIEPLETGCLDIWTHSPYIPPGGNGFK
jgi:hypothetical protein